MEPFLKSVAKQLIEKHQFNFEDVTVILPSKRAGLFLKKYLSEEITQTFWAPKTITIDEWIKEYCPLQVIDNTRLTFELYEVHKKIEKEEAESFNDFAKWSSITLADFNEIDKYLVDKSQLFINLKNVKELENWNIDDWSYNIEKLHPEQEKFLHFWNKLENYYNQLNGNLKEKGLCYSGYTYRYFAEHLAEISEDLKELYFVGFNALSTAEETIIKKLTQTKKAIAYWDIDKTYLEQEFHEAGHFLRRYKKNWLKPELEIKSHFSNTKNVNVIGVSNKFGQTNVAANLLKEQINFSEVGLVLADENLLSSTLSFLPENIEATNITMGYGLNNSSIHNLILLVLKMSENCSRLKIFGKVHFKDFTSILNNELVNQLMLTKTNLSKVTNYLIRNNISLLTKKNLEFLLEEDFELLKEIFSPQKDVLTWISNIINLVKNVLDEKSKDPVLQEELFSYTLAFNEIKSICNQYKYIPTLGVLKRLLFQEIQKNKLSFIGEPISGLQIMGMLETRLLDFKKLIILSVNESVLPNSVAENSFIPYDLKKHFGLPTKKEKEAIYAYHFYRLLQRTTDIHLIHNTEIDDLGNGEPSRYLNQIIYQWRDLPNINLKQEVISFKNNVTPNNSIEIKKDEVVQEYINQFFESGISTTAIGSYLNCPVDFFFKYILRIGETDEIEEDISALSFGIIVHNVLENIYTPYVGKILKESELKELKKSVSVLVEEEFLARFKGANIKQGKNVLAVNTIQNFVFNYIDFDIKRIKNGELIKLIGLEDDLRHQLEIEVNGEKRTALIKGKVDRIEEVNGVVNIIDYKTGKTEAKDLILKEDCLDLFDSAKNLKKIQLLMYALLYNKQNGKANIESSIYSFKNQKAGFLPFVLSKNKTKSKEIELDLINQFELNLKSLVEEIANSSIDFEENEDFFYSTLLKEKDSF